MLVSIMFTDMEGYTRLMHEDEATALRKRNRHREVLEAAHERFGGTLVQYFGDGTLSTFASAVDALNCASEIQIQLQSPEYVALRIGLHMGEVRIEPDSIFGDAVNIASRIESFSVVGAVLFSQTIYEQIRNKPQFQVKPLGKFLFKNVKEPVELYALANEGLVVPNAEDLSGKGQRFKPKIHHLPQHLTSFLGREKEIDEIKSLLSQHRLVTQTGPGGTGKTRLAARVAEEIAAQFEDGVYWVSLAPIFDAALVAMILVQELGLEKNISLSAEEMLLAFLEERKLLLILDNFEQIIDATPLVERLLLSCPNLHILVTSRMPLQIVGEVEYAVKPLPLPARQVSLNLDRLQTFPSIELFCQRAKSVKHEFTLTEENSAQVAEICHRLDGLPLAIELAAAQAKLFSPALLLDQLGARLDVLQSNNRNVPERHQTIRQTIAWSYQLLSKAEKQLFCNLAVFVGGATVEAIQHICLQNKVNQWGASQRIKTLLDKSLLQSEEKIQLRFYMLETIREFATQELLNSKRSEALKQAHAEYYLSLAEEGAKHLSTATQGQWPEILEQEQENFRAAIESLISIENIDLCYRFALALRPIWGTRGMTVEGIQLLERMLQLPVTNTNTDQRLKILQELGVMYFYIGNFTKAIPIFQENLQYWRKVKDQEQITRTLNNLSWSLASTGAYNESVKHSSEALILAIKANHIHNQIAANNNLGWAFMVIGHLKEAIPYFLKNNSLTEQVKDERRHAYSKINLTNIARRQANYIQAIPLAEDAIRVFRKNHDKIMISYTLYLLGICYIGVKQLSKAREASTEGEMLGRDTNSPFLIAGGLEVKGIIALEQGDYESAEQWLIQGLEWIKKIEQRSWKMEILTTLNQARLLNGKVLEAMLSIQEMLEISADGQSYNELAQSWELKAHLCWLDGHFDKAVMLLAKAAALQQKFTFRRLPLETEQVNELKQTLKETVGKEQFEDNWNKGTQLELQQAITFGLQDF